jgi:hypothetical protein
MLFTCHFSIFLKYKELFYETGTLFHPRRVDIQVIMAYTHRRSHLVLLKNVCSTHEIHMGICEQSVFKERAFISYHLRTFTMVNENLSTLCSRFHITL